MEILVRFWDFFIASLPFSIVFLLPVFFLGRWMFRRIQRNKILKKLLDWAIQRKFKFQLHRVQWHRHLFPNFNFFVEFCNGQWIDLCRSHRMAGNWKGKDFEAFTMEYKNQKHLSHGFTKHHACVLIMDAGFPISNLKRPTELDPRCRFEVRGQDVMIAYEGAMFWGGADLEKNLNLLEEALSMAVTKINTR